MRVKLDEAQISKEMQALSGWTLQGDTIEKNFTFGDFADAMVFVNRVAEIAEEEGHHPDIRIVYNKVTLTLSTHDAGGLTHNDFRSARRIDELKR